MRRAYWQVLGIIVAVSLLFSGFAKAIGVCDNVEGYLGKLDDKIDTAVKYHGNTQSPGTLIDTFICIPDITDQKIKEIEQLGFVLSGRGENQVNGQATNESVYKIAELDYVVYIGDAKVYENLTTLPIQESEGGFPDIPLLLILIVVAGATIVYLKLRR